MMEKLCLLCKGPVLGSKPSHIKKKKYCNYACSALAKKGEGNPNWRGGFKTNCEICNVEILTIPAFSQIRKYCGKRCQGQALSKKYRGDRSPLWKGGPKQSKARYRQKTTGERRSRKARLCTISKSEGLPKGESFHQACKRNAQSFLAAPRTSMPRVIKPRFCKICGKVGVKKGCTMHPACKSPRGIPRRRLLTCIDCGIQKMINAKPSQERCGKCSFASRGGSNNANWKGGVTPEVRRLRNSKEYQAWRSSVFERDEYTCVHCGQKGGELNADHIKAFAEYPELRLEVSNGRTLCVPCHKLTDTYLSKGKRKKRLALQAAPGRIKA